MYPGVIEQVMAEQYQAFRTDGKGREKKWEKKVSRVVDSKDETAVNSRSEEHPPGYYKAAKHTPKEKQPRDEELYQFTVINFLV